MNEQSLVSLVKVEQEQVVTSSRKIAETFGKEHKNVIRSITELLAAQNGAARFFYETTYENRGKQYPEFLMNRDGFSLLVMGFTGKKALEWKMKYIQAFNKMETMLKNQANHDILLLDKQNENLVLQNENLDKQNENLKLQIELKKLDMQNNSTNTIKDVSTWETIVEREQENTQGLSTQGFGTLTDVANELSKKFNKTITAHLLNKYLVNEGLAKKRVKVTKDNKQYKYNYLVDDYFIRNNIVRYEGFEYERDKISTTIRWNVNEAVRYFTTIQKKLFRWLKLNK